MTLKTLVVGYYTIPVQWVKVLQLLTTNLFHSLKIAGKGGDRNERKKI